jgi:hypothetical protein
MRRPGSVRDIGEVDFGFRFTLAAATRRLAELASFSRGRSPADGVGGEIEPGGRSHRFL